MLQLQVCCNYDAAYNLCRERRYSLRSSSNWPDNRSTISAPPKALYASGAPPCMAILIGGTSAMFILHTFLNTYDLIGFCSLMNCMCRLIWIRALLLFQVTSNCSPLAHISCPQRRQCVSVNTSRCIRSG
jgi:hypothetical protein